MKSNNLWTVGLDERGTQSYDSLDYKMDCAIVLGAEGKGLHDLVRKKCDFLISIPMLGKVPSLNVSVAAAVVLYEVVRQRRQRLSMKFFCVLCLLCGLNVCSHALDREAFTFTHYS